MADSTVFVFDNATLTSQYLAELIQDRKYGTFIKKTYPKCFIGAEAVSWLVEKGIAKDRPDAVNIGCDLVRSGIIHHVCDEHHFEDGTLFYRFLSDEPAEILAQRRHFSALQKIAMNSLLNTKGLLGGWSNRYFALQGGTLFMYNSEYAPSPSAAYSLEGATCSVTECEECHAGNYAFTLAIEHQKMTLSTKKSKDQEAWIVALTAAGAQFLDNASADEKTGASSLFELSAKTLDSGQEINFSQFVGKVCIVVNVASA
jgi:hypothetical protein